MNEQLSRLRKIYDESNMTYTAIADKLGVTVSYISKIMKNDNANVTERIILGTLKLFPRINEKWLRTGEGSPYLDTDSKAAIVSSLLENDNPFNDLILDIIDTYLSLSDTDKAAIDTLIDRHENKINE